MKQDNSFNGWIKELNFISLGPMHELTHVWAWIRRHPSDYDETTNVDVNEPEHSKWDEKFQGFGMSSPCTCPLKCQFCQFSTERLTTRQAYQKWYLRGLVYTKISYIDIWAVKIPQTTSISMMKCLRWIKKDVCLAQWICLSAYSSCWWNWKLSLIRAP